MTGKLKKVSMEILELGLKTGETRALPASPLPTALYAINYCTYVIQVVKKIFDK